jgi:hypothetical protein
MKPDSAKLVSFARILSKNTTAVVAPWTPWNICYNAAANPNKLIGVNVAIGTTQYATGFATAPSASAFHYVLGRYDNTNISCWLDGTQSGTNTAVTGTLVDSTQDPNMGRSDYATPQDWFSGQIDEVRLQTPARSNGWILTEYNMISSPQTFISQSNTPANYQGPIMIRTLRY